MNFPLRTEIAIEKSLWDLHYKSPILFMGSCFSNHIGGMLQRCKFPILLNPFGILYNPISIATAFDMIIDQCEIKKEELILNNNLWHSFQFHGSFSNSSSEKVIENCNQSICDSFLFLKNAQFLFITFGTAWAFRLKETGEVVSNCHKVPEEKFDRFRLSIEEIIKDWIPLLTRIHEINSQIKVIFTVSPIRHFKDGAHENQLSKSTLLLAIDEIVRTYPIQQIGYFPSYELMNDELRDYRFYDSDMVHISETGINFIFEKFKTVYFTESTSICYDKIQSLIKAKEHRLLTDDSKSINNFSKSMISMIEKLKSAYPYINFQPELEHFRKLGCLEGGFY